MTPTEAFALVAKLRAKQRLGQSLSRKETWQLLDAIEALARALAEGPKVKPLMWQGREGNFLRANGIDRVYEIVALADGTFFLTNGPRLRDCPTLEAAKAAAEADHRARVLAQLEGQA